MKKKIIASALVVIFVLLFGITSARAETVTKTIDATKDTWLDEFNTNSIHWGEISTKVGIYYSDPLHRYYSTALIYFDYLTAIPAGATVTSAKMKLWAFSCSGESSAEIVVNEIIHDWNSSTNDGNFFPGYGGEAYSEFIVDGCGKYIEADVLSIVNDIRNNGIPNYGFFLNNMRGGPAFTRAFCTSEYGDYGPRPKLIITYTTSDSGSPSSASTPTGNPTGVSSSKSGAGQSTTGAIYTSDQPVDQQTNDQTIGEKSKTFWQEAIDYYHGLGPSMKILLIILAVYILLLGLAFIVAIIIAIIAMVKNHRRHKSPQKPTLS